MRIRGRGRAPVNNKAEMVRRVSEATHLPSDLVDLVVTAVASYAADEVARTGEFRLMDVVTVRTRVLPRRHARDPRTGENREFPEVRTLVAKTNHRLRTAFRDGPAFKGEVEQ